jgi:hypothetical protein
LPLGYWLSLAVSTLLLGLIILRLVFLMAQAKYLNRLEVQLVWDREAGPLDIGKLVAADYDPQGYLLELRGTRWHLRQGWKVRSHQAFAIPGESGEFSFQDKAVPGNPFGTGPLVWQLRIYRLKAPLEAPQTPEPWTRKKLNCPAEDP